MATGRKARQDSPIFALLAEDLVSYPSSMQLAQQTTFCLY